MWIRGMRQRLAKEGDVEWTVEMRQVDVAWTRGQRRGCPGEEKGLPRCRRRRRRGLAAERPHLPAARRHPCKGQNQQEGRAPPLRKHQ